MSETANDCQVIECTTEADVDVYSLQNIPPTPLVPVSTTKLYGNSTVYYSMTACGLGQQLGVTGIPLPSWITFDDTNHRLIGAANTWFNEAQADATTEAQATLDAWADAAIAAGQLGCVATVLTLFYDDFEDYTDGVTVNGLALGDWSNLPSPFVDI